MSITDKKQMVTHTQKFRLFADVKMIPQVLLVRRFIQAVDKILKQFAGTIGCNLVDDLYTGSAKKLSAMIRGMEHKGEIIQAEGLFVVVTVHQVIILALLHGQDHHVVGDKRKEDPSVRLTDPLCFFNAQQLVLFLMQMIKRTKQKDNIEGVTVIPA